MRSKGYESKKTVWQDRIALFRKYITERTLLWGIIICMTIIIADIFDGCSFMLSNLGAVGFGFVALLCFCVVILSTKAWEWLRPPVVTEFDRALMSGMVAGSLLLAYTLALYIMGDAQFNIYKPVLAAGMLLLLVVSLIFRNHKLTGNEDERIYNTYTLKELYQGDITGTGGIIYFEKGSRGLRLA